MYDTIVRNGKIIDGTGKNYKKIEGQVERLRGLGYDCYMVFVNTSLEVALERNNARARKLPKDMVTKMWDEVQQNLGKFQRLFKAKRFEIVDNSKYGDKRAQRSAQRETETETERKNDFHRDHGVLIRSPLFSFHP